MLVLRHQTPGAYKLTHSYVIKRRSGGAFNVGVSRLLQRAHTWEICRYATTKRHSFVSRWGDAAACIYRRNGGAAGIRGGNAPHGRYGARCGPISDVLEMSRAGRSWLA